jgi:hypothetical protein
MIAATTAIFGAIVASTSWCNAFYLPGVAPHNYEVDEPVELKVNKLR